VRRRDDGFEILKVVESSALLVQKNGFTILEVQSNGKQMGKGKFSKGAQRSKQAKTDSNLECRALEGGDRVGAEESRDVNKPNGSHVHLQTSLAQPQFAVNLLRGTKAKGTRAYDGGQKVLYKIMS
jgi:hypothetical protein